mmetsp:Transcript_8019/g.24154  ORF Transcript_8019/g.24154 Transcript_8019/m.24154 type:complete len:271 (+) Transcript_8019:112-924(+)
MRSRMLSSVSFSAAAVTVWRILDQSSSSNFSRTAATSTPTFAGAANSIQSSTTMRPRSCLTVIFPPKRSRANGGTMVESLSSSFAACPSPRFDFSLKASQPDSRADSLKLTLFLSRKTLLPFFSRSFSSRGSVRPSAGMLPPATARYFCGGASTRTTLGYSAAQSTALFISSESLLTSFSGSKPMSRRASLSSLRPLAIELMVRLEIPFASQNFFWLSDFRYLSNSRASARRSDLPQLKELFTSLFGNGMRSAMAAAILREESAHPNSEP